MKVTLTVTVGGYAPSTDLSPALMGAIEAEAKATGHGVMSIIVDAIERGMNGADESCDLCGAAPAPHRDETVLGGMDLCRSCAENADGDEGLLHAVREAIG